ncbi:hypothetical protein N665_2975s0001 [Sinapis alba]|nr:hypothetical protein N665_2975s0001 [Sinapis alba]
MKFMKLGTKPDSFQSDEDCIRYVASDLATDIVVNVGDVKFYLHKFPLLSKSDRLQKLIAATIDEQSDNEINIPDIPGGPPAFEICAKFCYGMTVTLNAYNVVAARCAAEYLEMYESIESGNLVYKIEVFLKTSVLRSWKDSIIVLQTTRTFHPWSEDVKIDVRCLESIALKAAVEPARVDWSYTYNRRKVHNNGVVSRDWWVEDLAELSIDLYKRVISTIRSKGGVVAPEVIGEALEVYAAKRRIQTDDDVDEQRFLFETLISLLPSEKQSVSCGFLIKLLISSVSLLGCGVEEDVRRKLSRRIGKKLEEANVDDLLLIRASSEGCETVYDIDIVDNLIDEFITYTQKRHELDCSDIINQGNVSVSDSSKAVVAKLIDGYLAEISRVEVNFSTSKFIAIAEKVSCFPRSSHDGVYRAIDMFLKQHPEITKSEKKTICRLMDCRKLSPEACAHAVQNERLPLRVVVQILFFEQVRATAKPSLPPSGSHGSSRTTTEEECDSVTATTEETTRDKTSSSEKTKAKGVVMSRIFSKLWTGKDRDGVGDVSSSDTSESPGSATTVDDKSTPSTRRSRSSS